MNSYYRAFLYMERPFYWGMGLNTFDGELKIKPEYRKHSFFTDSENLRDTWNSVGKDLWFAVKKHDLDPNG